MQKRLFGILTLLSIMLGISGCNSMDDKTTSLSIIYCIAAVFSLFLLLGSFFLVRKKRAWITLLFSSVLVVNIGYTILSISTSLEMALHANRLAYLGSVFLPLSMLMIILNVTNTKYKKWLPGILFGIAAIVFLIAASPGILDIYYKEVSFSIVNGVSTLVKEYGPLHHLYLLYLLGYFAAMVVMIIRAQIKKTIDSTAHAVILTIAVFVNIGVWFIEQITTIQFEMLSISYIISELFLLGVHVVMNENKRLRDIVKQVNATQSNECESKSLSMLEKPLEIEMIASDRIEFFINGLKQLTPTEREIYEAYIARVTTKEVMANLNIKESTLKFHNRNIYSKLGVSSRKDLLELHKYIKTVKSRLDESVSDSDR